MRPKYEQFRGFRRSEKQVTTVRLPAGLRCVIEEIANGEHDTVTGLVIEGLVRVVEDRIPDHAHETIRNLEIEKIEAQTEVKK